MAAVRWCKSGCFATQKSCAFTKMENEINFSVSKKYQGSCKLPLVILSEKLFIYIKPYKYLYFSIIVSFYYMFIYCIVKNCFHYLLIKKKTFYLSYHVTYFQSISPSVQVLAPLISNSLYNNNLSPLKIKFLCKKPLFRF